MTSRSYEWDMQREEAETVPCPECQAPPGESCQELGKFPAHWRRIKAADEAKEQT